MERVGGDGGAVKEDSPPAQGPRRSREGSATNGRPSGLPAEVLDGSSANAGRACKKGNGGYGPISDKRSATGLEVVPWASRAIIEGLDRTSGEAYGAHGPRR